MAKKIFRRWRSKSPSALAQPHKTWFRHPVSVPLGTLLFLSIITFLSVSHYGVRPLDHTTSRVVILNADGKRRSLPTSAANVSQLLERADIVLREGDIVEPDPQTEIFDDNFRINVYRAKPVVIFDGPQRVQTFSAASTPRSVAAQAGLTVYAEDQINTEFSDNQVRDQVLGNKIVINRSTPVSLTLYGTPLSLRTQSKTVGELLGEKNINLHEGDTVQPAIDQALNSGSQVFVNHQGTVVTLVEETINPPVQIIEDNTLSFGTMVVRQQGVAGKKATTYQINMLNNVEVSRTILQEVVVSAAVPQIIARGQAYTVPSDRQSLLIAAGISVNDYPYVNYIISRESGWCATKWQGQVGYCPAYYQQLYSPSAKIGFGLCQSTPPNKMASAGADWTTNPVTQLKWCNGYAVGRYGSWQGAYNWWVVHSWW